VAVAEACSSFQVLVVALLEAWTIFIADSGTDEQTQEGFRISWYARRRSTMALQDFVEEVQVLGRDLVDKVKFLIHEANVQRIIIKDVYGNTYVEIPVSVAAVGVISGTCPRRGWRYISPRSKIHYCCGTG
jgi:hypothetical protein